MKEEETYFDMTDYVNKRMKDGIRKFYEIIENILREHIDNPIQGEITHEKMKAANISGFIYEKREKIPPTYEWKDNTLSLVVETNCLGIRQGDNLIQQDGNRIPVDEIPVDWYEEKIIY